MIVEYTIEIKVGWKGDSQSGYPEYRKERIDGEVVGYVQRYETGASAIIRTGSGFEVVDVTELTIIRE